MVRPYAQRQLPRTFNDQVGLDLREELDAEGKQYIFLDVLDMATSFSGYYLVDSNSASEVVTTLEKRWFSWTGVPRAFYTDQGPEFRGAFREALERWQAECEVTPTEASWRHGAVERHGQVLGDILSMMVEAANIIGPEEMELAALFAAQAKNRRVDRSGHSARERVFGTPERLREEAAIVQGLVAPEHCAVGCFR
jgi:transposase InsO family protein